MSRTLVALGPSTPRSASPDAGLGGPEARVWSARRARAWQLLDGDGADGGADRVVHLALLALILANVLANVLAIVVESMPSVKASPALHGALNRFETVSLWVFLGEYLLRLWASGDATEARGRTGWHRRLGFVTSPMGLVDLGALLPLLLPLVGVDIRAYSLLRSVRVFRMVKIFRYLPGIELIRAAVRAHARVLLGSLGILFTILVFGSTVMYFLEGAGQPDKFGSIPQCMWWAAATMTTIGYGDVFPLTDAGRVVGALFGMVGIFTFALPTAILGSAFMDEVSRRRQAGLTSAAPAPLRPEPDRSPRRLLGPASDAAA